MTQVLLWVQHLPVFVSIAEADSVWAYPTVLMLHTVGLGWLVGLNTVVNLRRSVSAGASRLEASRSCFR